MKREDLVVYEGELCRRLKGTGQLRPVAKERVYFERDLVRTEDLFWEVSMGEILGPNWEVKRIGGPDSPIELKNLVKVMKFSGIFSQEYVRSHFDYDPKTGKLRRKYMVKRGCEGEYPNTVCLGQIVMHTHRFIWLWMTGQNLANHQRVVFKNGDKKDFRWENLMLDRRSKERAEESDIVEHVKWSRRSGAIDVL